MYTIPMSSLCITRQSQKRQRMRAQLWAQEGANKKHHNQTETLNNCSRPASSCHRTIPSGAVLLKVTQLVNTSHLLNAALSTAAAFLSLEAEEERVFLPSSTHTQRSLVSEMFKKSATLIIPFTSHCLLSRSLPLIGCVCCCHCRSVSSDSLRPSPSAVSRRPRAACNVTSERPYWRHCPPSSRTWTS